MRVALHLPPELRKYAANEAMVTVEGERYLDLIRDAARQYPALGQRMLNARQDLYDHWILLEDGRPLSKPQLRAPIADQVRQVQLFGVASGG